MQHSNAYFAGDDFQDEFSLFKNWDNSDFILQNQDIELFPDDFQNFDQMISEVFENKNEDPQIEFISEPVNNAHNGQTYTYVYGVLEPRPSESNSSNDEIEESEAENEMPNTPVPRQFEKSEAENEIADTPTPRQIKKYECPWKNCTFKDRRDNLETHCRSAHAKSEPFICAHVSKDGTGRWKPCLYSTGRQNDLTKHYKSMHLKQKHKLLPAVFYRQYLNQNADFMHYLGKRVQRKTTAVFNKAKKVGDHDTLSYLKMGKIPDLKTTYNGKMSRKAVFSNPKINFCGVELKLNDFSRNGLFDGYELGKPDSRVFDEDYFKRPYYRNDPEERDMWDATHLERWTWKVSTYIEKMQ